MNVYRFDNLTINGNPVQVPKGVNGSTLLDPLPFTYVEVAETETPAEAIEFYGLSVLGLDEVKEFNWDKLTFVGTTGAK